MIKYQNAIKAAKEYREGLALKDQKQQLSCNALAFKFSRSHRTIRAIAKGLSPANIPQEELDLIRRCLKERKEIEAKYRSKTMESVCARYHVTGQTVRNYLEVVR